jgi:hypothetical protein
MSSFISTNIYELSSKLSFTIHQLINLYIPMNHMNILVMCSYMMMITYIIDGGIIITGNCTVIIRS